MASVMCRARWEKALNREATRPGGAKGSLSAMRAPARQRRRQGLARWLHLHSCRFEADVAIGWCSLPSRFHYDTPSMMHWLD